MDQHVPVVAFCSVQGGVGKSTLARKFAELVTVAPGRDGHRPNVLLVDLDVEAEGLTSRLANGRRNTVRTVHEVFAEQNVAMAQAISVTTEVALASGNPKERGELYLMPGAPPDAHALFDTLAGIDREELLALMRDMLHALIAKYDVSCVVLDCAPGANPYTSAAATLANVPLLIGRNETATFEKIRVLPERFREFYPQFQPATQRTIINAVSVKEIFEARASEYTVFDYIPLTSDVIHETEGLPRTGSLRMLLFEKYIVEIIKPVFVDLRLSHLIPEPPEVVGQEWVDRLQRLERCDRAPKVKRLGLAARLRWVGIAVVGIGILLLAANGLFDDAPRWLASAGVALAVAGAVLGAVGARAARDRERLLATARALVHGGPDEVFRRLQEGAAQRSELEQMTRIAETIGPEENEENEEEARR